MDDTCVLISRAADHPEDRPFMEDCLRELAEKGVRCHHIDDGTGLGSVEPVLLTPTNRLEGPAAIEDFLRSGAGKTFAADPTRR